MSESESPQPESRRHQLTRANRQQAGVVAVQLLLPPELVRRLDAARGPRPRTAVALEWLLAQSGLGAAAVPPALRRGRPRKVTPVPAPPPPPVAAAPLPPMALEVVNWAALLARVPDPRRLAQQTPPERSCRQESGDDGFTRLRWDWLDDDDEFTARRRFVKTQGGTWRKEPEHFGGAGGWVVTPEAADACIGRFKLVDLSPYDLLSVSYEGWGIELIGCAPDPAPDLYQVLVLDFEAALAAAAPDPARALGLAMWLQANGQGRSWYRLREAAGNLPAGALVSEPFLAAEASDLLPPVWQERGLGVTHLVAPGPLRAAWAAVTLRATETAEGLVCPEPHTACPGHRLGGLLPGWLRARAKGKESLLLLRAEWDRLAERATLLGVATELAPRPRPAVALAFAPLLLPGWEERTPRTRCGHRLFPFQQQAVRFALEQDLRCLVGDEMGLGKTASAIAATNAANLRRTVVVCPLNALGVWRREIEAWSDAAGPKPAVAVIRATDETPELPGSGWALVTYDTLAGRDERVQVDTEGDHNALCAFLTNILGDPKRGLDKCGWAVIERVDANSTISDVGQKRASKTKAAARKRKARWEFSLRAEPRVADAVGELLLNGVGEWRPPAGLRGQLERAAVRLSRPVMAALQTWSPDLLVADEAHRLKNPAARRTLAVRELGATGRRAMLLTGTPLRNHAVDGKALLELILPERVWATMGRPGEEVKGVVKDLLARRMIRRLKRDVLKELPPKQRQRVPVRVHGADLHGYATAMALAEKKYGEALDETGSSAKARKAALPMWSMARRLLGVAKLKTGVPTDLITEVAQQKGAVIVFAHHREVLDALEKSLRENKLTVGRVDGQVAQEERIRVETEFQAGRLQVFLGGIQAAGEAITLTRADTVVFVEMAWVPGELLQAEDRGHRAGQKAKGYHVMHLTAEFDREDARKRLDQANATNLTLEQWLSAEEWRQWEETGWWTDKIDAFEENRQRLEAGADDFRLELTVENIDEHMVAALDEKVCHISEVLGEGADPLVAPAGEDAGGMARLARATEERVRRLKG